MGFGCAVLGLLAIVGVDDFGRDVRPILAENCFHCHGPDATKRQAGLRLDVRESATRVLESGKIALVPGKPAASELVRRIEAHGDEAMPPKESLKRLTADQKQTLIRWIAAGAEYRPHWAFVAPTRPVAPTVSDPARARSPLDRFVLTKLEESRLRPSPEADRVTLLRRVTLDLTGLPPTPEEVDAFVGDSAPDAFERAVDRLLASPRYGEHMARDWLDLARYSDTHGYFTDHERFMWRWRDWVIDACNRNLPFDQFTIEQLAGDLLPDATLDQRIATGFNRNHMITEETGVIPEEYRTEYVADRVRTTASVWMGLTAGCAQCHDHKYDPLTQREFFQLFAYFNNLPEAGIAGGKQKNAAPELRLPSREQSAAQDELTRRLGEVERELAGYSLPSEPSDLAASAQRTVLESRRTKLREDEKQLLATFATTMVMQELPQPRDTFILMRGQYDQPGDKVGPGVPSFLSPLPTGTEPNRLALARWLVDPRHPLTARVAANRIWRQLFGHGIVATVEDFGLQGEFPSHPELLDWLAVEFAEQSREESRETRARAESASPTASSGSRLSSLNSRLAWDTKRLQRLIVTSATYRHASGITPESLRVDPRNRLLGRAPRYRLDAEAIRDAALFSSGLLAERIGGPSVKPYQPADLWKAVVYDTKNTQSYEPSRGEGLYRRSMYTYWKRQVPPPSMSQLDAPTREVCVLRRQRTNTPLQALVLMNDPQFVEAARALAERMATSSRDDQSRLTNGFRWATSRTPSDSERDTLMRLFAAERSRFRERTRSVDSLLAVGESSVATGLDRAELAAWTVVANVLLNLDEAISRE
ncbi:MAG: PSD1 and planctomycete cytochrome C domain-containing protein [Planctomycetota bacterium]